jgi:hypothetical protein
MEVKMFHLLLQRVHTVLYTTTCVCVSQEGSKKKYKVIGVKTS